MNCGIGSVQINNKGQLFCVVCKNIGGAGAVTHTCYDAYGDKRFFHTYLNKDGSGFCEKDPRLKPENNLIELRDQQNY